MGKAIGRPDIIKKKKGYILLMDDESLIRKVVGFMLVRMGYSVFYAGDGKEAIELVIQKKREEISLTAIILDITVPGGMGGKETIQKIRSIDSNTPAIASSGYCEDPIMSNPTSYGFQASLQKPYHAKELEIVLENVIRKGQESFSIFGNTSG